MTSPSAVRSPDDLSTYARSLTIDPRGKFSGKLLYVANESSRTVNVYTIDATSGSITSVPVSVQFLARRPLLASRASCLVLRYCRDSGLILGNLFVLWIVTSEPVTDTLAATANWDVAQGS